MAYFDNAATTYPKPEVVYTSMDKFYRLNGANAGRGLYFLNAPGRGCFLYGLFCGLPYLGRQALPFVFQDCSLPFHSQR